MSFTRWKSQVQVLLCAPPRPPETGVLRFWGRAWWPDGGPTALVARRSTCGCYLANAPGIFAVASAFRAAQQLGHSIAVAERHYLGTLRSIPKDATTIEAAMQIVEQRGGNVVRRAKHRG